MPRSTQIPAALLTAILLFASTAPWAGAGGTPSLLAQATVSQGASDPIRPRDGAGLTGTPAPRRPFPGS